MTVIVSLAGMAGVIVQPCFRRSARMRSRGVNRLPWMAARPALISREPDLTIISAGHPIVARWWAQSVATRRHDQDARHNMRPRVFRDIAPGRSIDRLGTLG